MYAPCPTGWGCESDATIPLGKSVVDTGLWPLAEWENGSLTITRKPSAFDPLQTYFGEQGRFRSVDAESIAAIERNRDETWRQLRAWECETAGIIAMG
ncbi:hypothetical protein [Propionivibrio soli]|uniref:hypothetical protein n=1 Tax=Propionivibrio soli TaxID=2976531 RepID=UPI0021E77874|nr:hypothetical protein [Propionivibrio soli]